MTVTSGFFDSVSGDRTYNAQQMSSIFDGIILDGVFSNVDNGLEVVENSGMNIYVQSGRAWFESTWTYNDSNYGITVPTAHALLPRIDVVYLEVNKGTGVRANSLGILQGTPASSPSPPTWTNTSTVFKYGLAEVYVGAGVTSISQSNITSLIGSTGTPWVKGPLINIVTDNSTLILDSGVLKVKDEGITVAKIANKVRSLFAPASLFVGSWGYLSAGYAFLDSAQYKGPYVKFTETTTSTIYGAIGIPKDIVSGTVMNVDLLWFAESNPGNARFDISFKVLYDGVNLTSGFPYSFSKTCSAAVKERVYQVPFGTTPAITLTYPAYIAFEVVRWPAHTGDNLSGSANVLGINFEYTADS